MNLRSTVPLLIVLGGCSSAATEPCAGAHGCACYPNSTCDGELVCSADFVCEGQGDATQDIASCYGAAFQCDNVPLDDCYLQDGCRLNLGVTLEEYDDDCTGHPTPCSELDLQFECESQRGCSWGNQGAAAGGPASSDFPAGEASSVSSSEGLAGQDVSEDEVMSVGPAGGEGSSDVASDYPDGHDSVESVPSAPTSDGASNDMASADPVESPSSGVPVGQSDDSAAPNAPAGSSTGVAAPDLPAAPASDMSSSADAAEPAGTDDVCAQLENDWSYADPTAHCCAAAWACENDLECTDVAHCVVECEVHACVALCFPPTPTPIVASLLDCLTSSDDVP